VIGRLTSIFCLSCFSALKFSILAARRASKFVLEMVENFVGASMYSSYSFLCFFERME
jgi:hypothetical protein